MPMSPMPIPIPDPARIPRAPQQPVNPPTAVALHALAAATDRLLATVDAMPAAAFAEPSKLPGWSRAHVLAHLALNAKALTGVLTTVGQDKPLPMYAPVPRRDSDIDRLAAQPPARIADRLAVGASMLAAHLGGGPTPEDSLESVGAAGQIATDLANSRTASPAVPGGGAPDAGPQTQAGGIFERVAAQSSDTITGWSVSGTFEQTPGGKVMQATEIPFMRWREVEIHHVDLGLGYAPSDWPAEFATYLLAVAAYDRDGQASMTLFPRELTPLTLSGPDPALEKAALEKAALEIHGSSADLAWWLVGRGSGDGLTVSGGELPALGPWARR